MSCDSMWCVQGCGVGAAGLLVGAFRPHTPDEEETRLPLDSLDEAPRPDCYAAAAQAEGRSLRS